MNHSTTGIVLITTLGILFILLLLVINYLRFSLIETYKFCRKDLGVITSFVFALCVVLWKGFTLCYDYPEEILSVFNYYTNPKKNRNKKEINS